MHRINVMMVLVMMGLLLVSTNAIAGNNHISVKALNSGVTYNTSGDEMEMPVGSTLNFEDKFQLKTNDSGKVLVDYYKEAKIILKKNTHAKLYLNSIMIKKGTSWMKFVKRGSTFKIKTPSAVLGIRGTEFTVNVDEIGNTKVDLVEGEISVKTDKEEKILTAGNSVTVDVNKKHAEIAPMSSVDKKQNKKENKFMEFKLDETEEEGIDLNDQLKNEKGNSVDLKPIEGLENLME